MSLNKVLNKVLFFVSFSFSPAGLPHITSSSRYSDPSFCRPAAPGTEYTNTAHTQTDTDRSIRISFNPPSVTVCVCCSDGDQSAEQQQ